MGRRSLQRETELAYLFIARDLSTVLYVSYDISVMS